MGQWKHSWQRCQCGKRRRTFSWQRLHQLFILLGFFEQCAQDMNVQRKYYWQPWLSDSTDVGVSYLSLFRWHHCFCSVFHDWFNNEEYSLHTFPPDMSAGWKQSPLEHYSVCATKTLWRQIKSLCPKVGRRRWETQACLNYKFHQKILIKLKFKITKPVYCVFIMHVFLVATSSQTVLATMFALQLGDEFNYITRILHNSY